MKFSTVGLVRQPTNIEGAADYVFSDNDKIVAITSPTPPALAGGMTFHLPGPTTDPDNLPSDGDTYAIAAPVFAGAPNPNVLFVDPGGYKLFGSTSPLGPCTPAGFFLVFVFDDVQGAWAFTGTLTP